MKTLARLNPYRGLPNGREVWAWGMYDLANQSFTLLIITLLFPIYFKNVAVANDPVAGDRRWAIAVSASLLIVVLVSPIVGAMTDLRGTRKKFLMGTGLGCAALTIAFVTIEPGAWRLAMLLFIAANVLYQLGENFLASFLPIVSTSRNIGRVSAIGWTMGYVGALLLLMFSVAGMMVFGWQSVERWRPLFVFAGVWFLIGMVAPMFVLKEPPPARADRRPSLRQAVVQGAASVRRTLTDAARFGELTRFFIAFFVYALGVQTMIAFAAILANDFGFTQTKLVLYVLQLTVTAGAGAILTGFIQDRIGARATVMIFLGVWIVTAAAMTSLTIPKNPPTWMLWVVGNGVGFGLGGVGTASRSMVGRFAPRHQTAEFFGLWGMVYKGAGVVGVLSFGLVKASLGGTASLALLTAFFVVGMALMVRVNETRGVRGAKRAERLWEKERRGGADMPA